MRLRQKEQAILASKTKNQMAKLEPLKSVNNKYLGLFRSDDYNNQAIKIGRNLYDIDISKIDPTKAKKPNRVPTPDPAAAALRRRPEQELLRPEAEERPPLHSRDVPQPAAEQGHQEAPGQGVVAPHPGRRSTAGSSP